MAFDAGMTAAVAAELRARLTEAKVEKIHQPERDEIDIFFHKDRSTIKLMISAGANNPRINITEQQKENPLTAPMFCMMLRKHLQGSKLLTVIQPVFDRVLELCFEAYDDLGFICNKYLIVEIMGTYSNIIFCDSEKKVLNAVRIIDFSTSQKRQILPGMKYEFPPAQNKRNPVGETNEGFTALLASADPDMPAEKFIMSNYCGMASLTAREIIFRTAHRTDALVGECDQNKLIFNFMRMFDAVRNEDYAPSLVRSPEEDRPLEYAFFKITQYENAAILSEKNSISEVVDEFFTKRDRAERIRQRSSDILRLLTNAENRLNKKIAIQRSDLAECAGKEKLKRSGDLITANLHMLERGMKQVKLIDYYDETMPEVTLELDTRLSPAQNAQRFYKKYNKAKTAEVELTKQIKLAEEELSYIYTVFDSLTRAETQADLDEIRAELHESGYASRMKNYTAQKLKRPKPMEFLTEGGYRLLCGKNNSQNDYVTTKVAEKNDYWFHTKNTPGSHVVMQCEGMEEPSERDFTQAAMVAAYYSKAGKGASVAVDYTLAKHVKKPSGSKPGFVIYTTNWTAYVTPDEKIVDSMRVKTK
ncbi:MAG: NFACT family protein [Clostridia bacterium]|nr:NFACT family protein [Clostridia bacterium]